MICIEWSGRVCAGHGTGSRRNWPGLRLQTPVLHPVISYLHTCVCSEHLMFWISIVCVANAEWRLLAVGYCFSAWISSSPLHILYLGRYVNPASVFYFTLPLSFNRLLTVMPAVCTRRLLIARDLSQHFHWLVRSLCARRFARMTTLLSICFATCRT